MSQHLWRGTLVVVLAIGFAIAIVAVRPIPKDGRRR